MNSQKNARNTDMPNRWKDVLLVKGPRSNVAEKVIDLAVSRYCGDHHGYVNTNPPQYRFNERGYGYLRITSKNTLIELMVRVERGHIPPSWQADRVVSRGNNQIAYDAICLKWKYNQGDMSGFIGKIERLFSEVCVPNFCAHDDRDPCLRNGVALSPDDESCGSVVRSLADDQAARRRRLSTAEKIPAKVVESVVRFVRNPDVVAEILFEAKGICQHCKKPAPFKRYGDSSPYLEVHHKNPLSEGGEDSVANAIALCPNCHRYFHFGVKAS